jgi:hypothetical protein
MQIIFNAFECVILDTHGTSRSLQIARAISRADRLSEYGAWLSAMLMSIKTPRIAWKSGVRNCLTSACPIASLCALRIAWCIMHRSPADNSAYARQTFAVAVNQIPQ